MSLFPQKAKKEKESIPKKKLKKKSEESQTAESKLEQPVSPQRIGFKEKQKAKAKDDTYIMKKNTGMMIFRVLFWLILIFIFARGVIEIVRPDKESELTRLIQEFKQEQQLVGNAPDEVMDFAQDFAKEYLTYQQSGETDFKDRIKPYVSKRIHTLSGIYSFRHAAKATYIHAYRREEEKNGQYNVYINAEIMYEKEQGNEYESCILKVPISVSELGYCVTSLPMYVKDERLDDTYNAPESRFGTEIDSSLIEPSIKNFLDAYYAQDQSMINYLLTSDADKSKFIGMNKRYTFKKIDTIKAYQQEGAAEINCILKIKIQDTMNEEEVYQEFNMTVIESNDKVYIKDIDTKITGLN